jgi:hypothetical protein
MGGGGVCYNAIKVSTSSFMNDTICIVKIIFTITMAKVLKITKPDKTIHVVPVSNLAFYQAQNKRLKAGMKWKLDQIDEKDAKDLPFKDEDYITGNEAAAKLTEAQKEIAALKEQLAAKNSAQPQQKYSAVEAIALIEVAKTVEQVEAISKDDDRATVRKAAEKRIEELEAA